MATTNTTAKNPITKVTLEPGMKIALEQNGVPLTAAQLDGKSLAVTKSGDSLMVTMPDGSQTELVDFFITEDVTLEGDFWEIPVDGGLTQTASGVIAQPTTLARAVDAGVLGEEAIATDVSATKITEAVAAVVAETEPAVGAGGFGGVLAGLAGLGLAAGGGGGTPAPAPAAADTVLSVGIFAGPVLEGHQLRIAAYDVDGNVLSAEKAVVLVDGRVDVTIRGDYSGPVLLVATDAGEGNDYVNEADGQPTDLAIDLRAIVQVDGTDRNINVNISLLSELVVQEILDIGPSPSAESIAQANKKIIEAVGLEGDTEVALRDVKTTVTVEGNVADDPNLVGQVLAAISGYETKIVESVKLGTASTIAALRAAIDADSQSGNGGQTTGLLAEGALLVEEAYGGGAAFARVVDKIAPTVVITSNADALKIGETAAITFTFSEAPEGFTDEDVVVQGGILSALTVDANDAKVYTATFTPNTDTTTAASITVSTGYTDAAGNTGVAGATPTIAIDTVAPVAPTLALGVGVSTGAGLSEALAGAVTVDTEFDASVAVTFTSATDSERTVTKTVTGTGSAQAVSLTAGDLTTLGEGTINVSAVATDVAGNASEASTASFDLDTTAPTVDITSDVDALKIGEEALITFTFSEAPEGFTDEDVVVQGGILSALTVDANDAKVYTATFTPNTDTTAAASITVTTGYTDAAANAGVAGETPVIAIDTLAPTVSTIAITSAVGVQNSRLNAGDEVSVTVTMSEAVTVDGEPQLGLVIGEDAVTAVYTGGTGTTELTFAYTVLAGQTDTSGISISADALTLNGGTIVDAAGNAATLTHNVVVDNSGFLVDTTAPTITITALSVAENTTTVGNLAASDTDSVTWSLAGTGDDESLFSISSTGALTLNAAADFETPGSSLNTSVYAINAIATDTAGNSSTQSIAVTVTNVNEAPTYVGTSGRTLGEDVYISITAGQAVNIDLTTHFDDPDGDTLTYARSGSASLPTGLTLSSAGVITGSVASEDAGT